MYVRLGRQPCQWKLEIISGSVVLDRFGKHQASASRDFCGSTEEKTRHRVGSRLWRTSATRFHFGSRQEGGSWASSLVLGHRDLRSVLRQCHGHFFRQDLWFHVLAVVFFMDAQLIFYTQEGCIHTAVYVTWYLHVREASIWSGEGNLLWCLMKGDANAFSYKVSFWQLLRSIGWSCRLLRGTETKLLYKRQQRLLQKGG